MMLNIKLFLLCLSLLISGGCASVATQRTYTETVDGKEVIVQEITLKGVRGMKAAGHDATGKAWSGETECIIRLPDFPAIKYEAD